MRTANPLLVLALLLSTQCMPNLQGEGFTTGATSTGDASTNGSSTGHPLTSSTPHPTTDTETDPSSTSTTTDPPQTSTETTDPTSGNISETTMMGPDCGNGKLDRGEQCDRGSQNADDAECTLDCKDAVCGDHLVHKDVEQCDDGNTTNDDDCTNKCKNAFCPDGILQMGEDCDDGNPDSHDSCTNKCKLATCGDGITQTGIELCDDGNTVQTDECLIGCAPASCGDGFVHTGAEACDDNNVMDGDGCTADCTAEERLVFVTSKGYNGRLQAYQQDPHPSLYGLALADARCQEHAKDKLPGTYRAWLSTDRTSAKDRLEIGFKGVYRLPAPGYPIVAIGLDGLISSMLLHEININESGTPINNNETWTSTTQKGLPMSENCINWTSNDNKDHAYYGLSGASDKSWTNSTFQQCNNFNRIYCFQISQ